MSAKSEDQITLLILGAGWTYQFLRPVLDVAHITNAATSTTGRDDTIPFKFDPASDDPEPFKKLPSAQYVLVTFPLKGTGSSKKLVSMYRETHSSLLAASGHGERRQQTKWIQLGSTGIYTAPDWNDSSSPIDHSNERGIAEQELISLGGCVLNLAGLYGAARQPANWIGRVAKTKEQLADKGALHLIHGVDVARAVVGVIKKDLGEGHGNHQVFGRRWIVADCQSYDWWTIVWDLTGEAKEEDNDYVVVKDVDDSEDGKSRQHEENANYRRWIMELMLERNVKTLPRPLETLGRKLDSREFWNAIGILPERTLARAVV